MQSRLGNRVMGYRSFADSLFCGFSVLWIHCSVDSLFCGFSVLRILCSGPLPLLSNDLNSSAHGFSAGPVLVQSNGFH